MIQGLVNFTDYFKDFEDDYVVIGGLATAMIMNDFGFLARATKDIDLVVVSKDNEEFLKKLIKYCEEAGYKTKQKTTNDTRHNLFRFFDSDDKNYPEQLELFAIHTDDSQIANDQHIIPIQTPQYYSYLSAILLDTDYFNLLTSHTTNIEGLHIATPEVLIPLKIHAYLNLTKLNSRDAQKHIKDVIRLIPLLDEESKIILQGQPKVDMLEFLPILKEIDSSRVKSILKSSAITNVSKDMVVELFTLVYV
jgi:hypothetical protein